MHRKLESDLQSGKKQLAELVDQCDNLKKGREESVKYISSISLWFKLNFMSLITDSQALPG